MEQSKLSLSELPGLETTKAFIEKRIEEIRRAYLADNPSAPVSLTPLDPNDPSILGRDSLGRIKRKRFISPELREQKKHQIAAARKLKLDRLREGKT